MNSIAEWLNGSRDYNTGVALLRCHTDDHLLLKMFEQGNSDYRSKRLEKELRERLRLADRAELPAKEPIPIPNISVGESVAAVEVKQSPAIKNDPYREQWTPLFQEMNALRHQLEDIADDATAGEMAFRVLDLERQCGKWWAKRDYLHVHGIELQEEAADADLLTVDKNQLYKSLTNIRSNISKTKKKLEKAPLNSELQQKLEAYECERDRIEKILKNE